MWSDATIRVDAVLYDLDRNANKMLYSVVNKNGIIGYIITDNGQTKVIEFALGESPYQNILHKDVDIKSINEKVNKKINLIYDAGTYFYSSDDNRTITKVDVLNNDSLSAVNSTLNDGILVSPRSIWQNINVIPGVPAETNNPPTIGCGPVSAMNLVKYWDSHGYPNLVSDSDTKQILYNKLYSALSCFPFLGDIATLPDSYKEGVRNYTTSHLVTNLIVLRYSSISNSDISILKTEVNNNRPGTILYDDSYRYGLHYVTFVGYAQDLVGDDFYIIHDLWSSTNVYRSWSNDVSDMNFWSIFTFRFN
ncbi:C39 family peptidase [Fusibacter ferrireducens]|uniref:C39 family peptidase n=1 Tax=Fusibacter ferrireducens TaxID=2785058 RepID=A0ABR9ZS42_9FIRM|nr:C39 family peptidase [Fusibacter ferrireducens]MBF4692449.1 C39 family peptidase [Fusibacter ferrireducens]